MIWQLVLFWYKFKNVIYILFIFNILFILLWALYFVDIDNLIIVDFTDFSKILLSDVEFWENLCNILYITYSAFNIYILIYIFLFIFFLLFYFIKIIFNRFNLYLIDKENKYLPFFSFMLFLWISCFCFYFFFGFIFNF